MTRSEHHDLAPHELLASWSAKALLAAAPPELRESFEGDLHERLQEDAQREHGVEGARRWLRRELLRSLPRMLRLRALGGAHPVRRAVLGAFLAALAGSEVVLVQGAEWSPPLALRTALVAASAFAVVVRARTAIKTLWFADYFAVGLVSAADLRGSPLVFSQFVMSAVSIAVWMRIPWNFWSWRFLTTWGGGVELSRRPRSA